MPLYEYQCAQCQKVHEVMQKFSDEPLKVCPDCQGALTKLMSLGSFALKGSGWYTTDYKRKSSGSSESASAASSAGSSGSSSPASSSATGTGSASSASTGGTSKAGTGGAGSSSSGSAS